MAIALPPPPPPPMALSSPASFGPLFKVLSKATSRAAPLVVLGGVILAVQKKALGISQDMEGIKISK